jgi:hypothetical protein
MKKFVLSLIFASGLMAAQTVSGQVSTGNPPPERHGYGQLYEGAETDCYADLRWCSAGRLWKLSGLQGPASPAW